MNPSMTLADWIRAFAACLVLLGTAALPALADDPPAKAGGVSSSVPPPFTSPAAVYSGVSGPGKPVVGDGSGGWRSGAEGVIYKGPDPKPRWSTNWGKHASGAAVKQGLIPPIKPSWDLHLRDTVICVGGDGHYYMTG